MGAWCSCFTSAASTGDISFDLVGKGICQDANGAYVYRRAWLWSDNLLVWGGAGENNRG